MLDCAGLSLCFINGVNKRRLPVKLMYGISGEVAYMHYSSKVNMHELLNKYSNNVFSPIFDRCQLQITVQIVLPV